MSTIARARRRLRAVARALARAVARTAAITVAGAAVVLPAAAASYVFPGALPAGCSGSGGSYTCSALTLGYQDTVTIAAPTPATITVNGDFTTAGNTLNGGDGGNPAQLTLVVTGTLALSDQTRIAAHIQAGVVTDSAGYSSITGSITSSSGAITLGFTSAVTGSVTSTSGPITIGQSNTIGGNVVSTSGAIVIGYEAKVAGGVSTAGAITLAQGAVVTGAISGSTGAVDIGYAATAKGPVSTSSGTITLAQNAVAQACVRSTSSAAITLGYQASVAGVCCGGSCTNSCVANNSTYTMPPPCAPSVDHYELWLPASGIACLPSTVTVKACADASSPCTSGATTVAGQTATLATSAGTLAATTLSFDASGVASTTLSHPGAAQGAVVSVTLSGEQTAAANARRCCPDGGNCSAASSCSITFDTAGFIVSASGGGAAATVPTQTAGSSSGAYVLRAVKTGTTTRACEAALTGATSVDWAAQCLNPSSCASGNRLTLSGSAATAIASNPASGITTRTAVAMTFDSDGNAPFSFVYADVGQIRLAARKVVGGHTLDGSSNAFVVKPASFAIGGIVQTAVPQLANPAATSADGARFVKAGESFGASVSALTASGAVAPNFGRETPPEAVLLTPTLVLPAGGSNGTLANATLAGGSFSAGTATVSNLAYSEVGIITLTPSVADGSYLGAGDVAGSASGAIGRFHPAQFALGATSVMHRSTLACAPASTFSYLGETFRLVFTVSAQNTSGATTTNYAGAFAKIDPTSAAAWQLAGRDGATVFSAASARLALGSASGSWVQGVASDVTLTAAALRADTPDGPFDAVFGIAPVDSDGVALAAFDMASAQGGANDRAAVGTLGLRFGRLRLASAIGAADRALALPATLQHWNGSAWDTNTLDSCTVVPTTALSFGNLRRTLTTADTSALAPIAFSAGRGSLRLAAPGGGRSGTFDVALSLGAGAADLSCLQPWTPGSGDAASTGANLAHLRGAWCGSAFDDDPSARASFGLQRTQDHVIYRRESN